MGDLQRYLADSSRGGTTQLIHSEAGAADAKSNYIALGLVPRNTLPDFGQSYNYGTAPGITVTLGATTIVSVLKALAFAGLCTFFGDTTINGKKGKPTASKASQKFGSEAAEQETGEVTEKIEFMYKYFYSNVEFFNGLRNGSNGEYDLYLFTDKTVECLRYDADRPRFVDIGHDKSGNYADDPAGGFSIVFIRDGELVPNYGVKRADLNADQQRYTFAASSPAATGLTAVVGSTERYTMATGTAGKITRAVNEGGAPYYKIAKNDKDPIPTTELVTINTDTGEVNFAATLPVGVYRYTVVAENIVGVWGKYRLVITVR